MVHGSQNRGSWASWGPTIIFSEKKSPYLNNLSLDHILYDHISHEMHVVQQFNYFRKFIRFGNLIRPFPLKGSSAKKLTLLQISYFGLEWGTPFHPWGRGAQNTEKSSVFSNGVGKRKSVLRNNNWH